jgi:hypothetical protein
MEYHASQHSILDATFDSCGACMMYGESLTASRRATKLCDVCCTDDLTHAVDHAAQCSILAVLGGHAVLGRCMTS